MRSVFEENAGHSTVLRLREHQKPIYVMLAVKILLKSSDRAPARLIYARKHNVSTVIQLKLPQKDFRYCPALWIELWIAKY